VRNGFLDAPHIFVISHERSGTHIAIDAIRNNFPIYKKRFYVNIDRMVEGHRAHCGSEIIEAKLEVPSVIKTHMVLDPGTFFDGDGSATQLVKSIVHDSKLIYLYRDGRDVLGSLFTFWSRSIPEFGGTDFSDMLRGNFAVNVGRARRNSTNPVSYWQEHVQNWAGREEVLALSFEEFLNDYDNTIMRISDFIGMPPVDPLKSVLRKGTGAQRGKLIEALFKFYTRKIKGIELTSVSFNKGSSGGHRAVYSKEDLVFFDEQAGDLLAHLGYPSRKYY